MTGSYCLRCKQKSANVAPHFEAVRGKGGSARKMLKSKCAVCGSKKAEFVKSDHSTKTGDGFFGKTLGGLAGGVLGGLLPF
jgi:predicted lipid-binding transport protein (Tim44 family)